MTPQTSYTYNGVTVNYSEAQKAIVLADQNLITTLQNQLIALQNEFADLDSKVAEAKSHLDNECNNYKDYEGFPPVKTNHRTNCIQQWNLVWTEARNRQDVITNTEIPNKNTQIASAKKKLNDDITVIENDIKIQIQTQIANTGAANQAASNQISLSQNTPAVLLANQQHQSAIEIEQLKNQAAADKLKQEQNIKIAGFVLLTIIIIGLGYVVIKKIF